MIETIRVFISYKREDQAFAEKLRTQLRSWGYATWLDVDDIPAGIEQGSGGWDSAIHTGMKASKAIIGLQTAKSFASENVLDEWDFAKRTERRLLFLRLEKIDEEVIPPRWGRPQYIACFPDEVVGLARLKTELDEFAQGRRNFDAEINPARTALSEEKKLLPIPDYLQKIPRRRLASWRLVVRTISVLVLFVSLIWLIVDIGFEPLLAFFAGLGVILTTFLEAQAEPLIGGNTPNDVQDIRRRVYWYWVKGFKDAALADVHQVGLGLGRSAEAVVQDRDLGEFDLRDSKGIRRIFNKYESFLILGDPGTGKTIMLLDLAESLILDPPKDKPNAIPLVLNLSSWALTRKPLDAWILDEAHRTYRVRPVAVREWLDNNAPILLLDGLDEVKDLYSRECIEKINAFREAKPIIPVVVCSRVTDYQRMVSGDDANKLVMPGAVIVQPLTQSQIDAALNDSALTHLRSIITDDLTLKEMTSTPFLLNTMIYAYRHKDEHVLRGYPTPEERRQHLFNTYFERRLDDNPLPRPYTKEKTLKYLKWLATKMQAYVQTVFRPEDIQPHWLADNVVAFHRLRELTIRYMAVWLMLTFGAFGWVGAAWIGLLTFGSLGVLIGYLIGDSLLPKEPAPIVTRRRFRLGPSRLNFRDQKLRFIILIALTACFAAGVSTSVLRSGRSDWAVVMVIGLSIFLTMRGSTFREPKRLLFDDILFRIIAVFITAVWAWSFTVIFDLYPWLSPLAFFFLYMVTILIVSKLDIDTTPPINVIPVWTEGLILFLIFSITIIGIVANAQSAVVLLVLALISLTTCLLGAIRILEYAFFRLFFLQERIIPIALNKFLDLLAQRRIMRVMGGGHVFIHRYLLENFASRDEVAILIRHIAQDDSYSDSYKRALNALERVESPFDLCLSFLKDTDYWMRSSAAEALGNLGDARALDPLLPLLNDTNHKVRNSAAGALGKLGDARAVDPLLPLLKDTDIWVRRSAAEALGNLGDARALDPLLLLLKDTDIWVRRSAAEALGNLGDARALDPLLPLLKDTHIWVRRSAAEALGNLGDARALDPLLPLLKDTNDGVRYRAAEALGKLGDARAVDPLLPLLKDTDIWVRRSAAEALRRIGTPDALENLERAKQMGNDKRDAGKA
jgi:HEAT repeat protein